MKKIFGSEEDEILIRLHNKYGNKWKKVFAERP